MSNKTINLETYIIQDIKKDMVECFDADYRGENGILEWVLSDETDDDGEYKTLAEVEGFENEAERFINEIFDEQGDDLTNITLILNKVGECWGSYADQFQHQITSCFDENGEIIYVVSVSYLY